MLSAIRNAILSRSGSTAIEYALVASLIALAIFAGVRGLSTTVQEMYNEISEEVSSAID
jgi:pilus assembly protein Flp/PilA